MSRPHGVKKRTARDRKPVKAQLIFNPGSFDSQFATLNATALSLSERVKANTDLLSERLENQSESFNNRMDNQDRMLLEIKEQTSKTNGRVTALETDLGNVKTERRISKAYIAGIAGSISAIVAVAGVLVKLFWH